MFGFAQLLDNPEDRYAGGNNSSISDEADQFLGMSMTYSLFEWVRESLDTLLEHQPESVQIVCDEVDKLSVKDSSEEPEEGKKVKKEQLTKGQKRAAWKKGGMNESDRERGWNWVDVVK